MCFSYYKSNNWCVCLIMSNVAQPMFTAEMAKAHNNANVLCLGGRTTSDEAAISLINTWLTTDFEDGRHQTRIDLIDASTS